MRNHGHALTRTLEAHRLFVSAMLLGVCLRLLTGLGYRSNLWFDGDSFAYLATAEDIYPDQVRPVGYSFLLWAFKPFHSLGLVTAVQHLAGLGIGVLLYAVARRAKLSALVGTLVAAPVLFGGYQLAIEHMIMAETLFSLLVVGALAILLWDRASVRVPVGTAMAVGLMLGSASVVRSVGLPVAVAVLAWVTCRRASWRTVAACAVTTAIPIITYASWYAAVHGRPALTDSTGPFLWSRTAPFADCTKFEVPLNQQWLCIPGPPSERASSPHYLWSPDSPIRQRPEASPIWSAATDAAATRFSVRAILAQPVDYSRLVFKDFVKAFAWTPDSATARYYRFPVDGARNTDLDGKIKLYGESYERGVAGPRVVEPLAGGLRAYQGAAYVPGPVLAALIGLGGLGLLLGTGRVRSDLLLLLTVAVILLAIPAATAAFDYRYTMPIEPLAALAAGSERARFGTRKCGMD